MVNYLVVRAFGDALAAAVADEGKGMYLLHPSWAVGVALDEADPLMADVWVNDPSRPSDVLKFKTTGKRLAAVRVDLRDGTSPLDIARALAAQLPPGTPTK